jgi:cyclopropane fatty-acyl-phospholipid synthase-like methyltransferase
MKAIYEDGTYLSNHETWHTEDSPWKAQQISKLIQRNDIKFIDAVEVGCGAGGVVYELSKLFPQVNFSGFEISPQATRFWNNYQSDNLQIKLADFLSTSKSYDLLCLIDVFEHVPDYMGFLKSLSSRSKYFIFNIPLDMHLLGVLLDHQVYSRNKYGHLHYFSKETALQTLTDTGYQIVDFFYAPGFLGAPPESSRKTWKQKSMYPGRWLMYHVSPSFSAKLLGGVSLMVLATSNAD